MPMWLYDQPNWLLGLTIVGATLGSCLAGYALFHRVVAFDATEAQQALALAVLPLVATIHALLTAFSSVAVWESYSAAEASVVEEANLVGELARDLAVFDSGDSARARSLLYTYARHVVDVEWRSMRSGEASAASWEDFDELFRSVGALQPDTPRRVALMPEIWARTNELLKLRRERLHAANSEIPSTLWWVVLIETVLTFAITYVMPATRFNVLIISALAASMGLVFFFLIAMDRPFAGRESISTAPYISALDNMDRWDRATAQ